MTCSSCALALPADARFCLRCGASIAAGPPVDEERKVVTVLFCDLVGSTELSGILDPEPLRAILLRYYTLMEESIHAYGGIVEKFIGDAVMAVFGLTVTHEDDARRALTAAQSMVEALSELHENLSPDRTVVLRIRIGVHTGEVVTTADASTRQALVSGEVVNIAARLEQAAGAGQVFLSVATARAAGPALVVADVGGLTLKGLSEPFEALRLVAVSPADHEAMRRFDVPFVGREREICAIDLAWRQVVEQGNVHVLTLLGEAGIGKTRLVREWLGKRADEIGISAMGRCQSFGTGGSLHALAECVAPLVAEIERRAVGADPSLDAAIALLRKGLLLDGTPSPSSDETAAAVTHMLYTLAFERPVLVVLDDCHWGEPTLLSMLDRLMEDLDRMPVMFLCAARPELIQEVPSWGTGRINATTVTVSGLAPAESDLLAANLIDVASHDSDTLQRVVVQAAGNPLYLEQLAAIVCEEGASSDHLPPTLHALLAARIDRLEDDERTAVRCAAVLDSEFNTEDLRQIAGDAGTLTGYASVMRGLVRRQFLEPLRRPFGATPAYRFANVMVQRVVYEGLTKRRRAELHERCAEYLAGRNASDALVGNHVEKAYRYHAEVGPSDDRTTSLRQRAVDCLARAGTSALQRVDLPWALALLGRAVDLAEPGDPFRPECLQQLGEVRLTLGCLDEAQEILRQAVAAAEEAGLNATAMHARLHLAISQRNELALEHVARQALPVFSHCADDLGLTRCDLILAASLQRRGRHHEALKILDRALIQSVSAGANRELANVLGALGASLWHGPESAPSAIERCRALLTAYGGGRRPVQATLGFPLTVLYAIHGYRAKAAEWLSETHNAMSVLSYSEAGIFRPLLTALVAIAADEGAAAEDALHEALDLAHALRATGLIQVTAHELARVYLARGRRRDAEDLVDHVEVSEGDPAELANHLGIKARIGALRGHGNAAVELANEAVAVAGHTQSPGGQALAYLDLADAMVHAGLPGPAMTAARTARRLYTAKGHLVGVARAQLLLSELDTSDTGQKDPS